jgi:hypothetical protein
LQQLSEQIRREHHRFVGPGPGGNDLGHRHGDDWHQSLQALQGSGWGG